MLALSVIIVIGQSIVESELWNGGVTPRRFDAEVWKQCAAIGNYRTTRSQMVEDFVTRNDIRGCSRPEVISILGEPDVTGRQLQLPGSSMIYSIGLERQGAFSLDFEYLVIRLDSVGSVSGMAIVVF